MQKYDRKNNFKKYLLVLLGICLIVAGFFAYRLFFATPFVRKIEVEAGSHYDLNKWLKKPHKKVNLVSGLDKKAIKKVGEHEVKVKVDGSVYTTKVHVVDTTAPTIKNVNDVSVLLGEKADYTKGIQLEDNSDSKVKLSVDSSQVNTSKMGIYPITYKATDASGNVAKVNKKCIVYVDPLKQKNSETKEKIVYLTFDDGPSQNTGRVLDILKKNNVHATFFVTAQFPKYFNYMKRAHDEGNAIAAHSYSHDFKIYKSEKTYFDDLNKIESIIKKYTGEESKMIRFPGGSSNAVSKHYQKGIMTKLTRNVLVKGYQYVDWNLDSTDASGNNVPVEKLVSHATSTFSNNICLLMHDTGAKNTTVEALPRIIQYYKDKGYKFGTLTDTSYVCHHNHLNN